MLTTTIIMQIKKLNKTQIIKVNWSTEIKPLINVYLIARLEIMKINDNSTS